MDISHIKANIYMSRTYVYRPSAPARSGRIPLCDNKSPAIYACVPSCFSSAAISCLIYTYHYLPYAYTNEVVVFGMNAFDTQLPNTLKNTI